MKPLIESVIFLVLVGTCVDPICAQAPDSKDAKLELSSYQIERRTCLCKEDSGGSKSRRICEAKSSGTFDEEFTLLPTMKSRNFRRQLPRFGTPFSKCMMKLDLRKLRKGRNGNWLFSTHHLRPKNRRFESTWQLFAARRAQPLKNGSFALSNSVGPMSLTSLREAGALENTTQGLLILGNIGCSLKNDRGAHAFPKNVGGSLDGEELLMLAPAQELLLKYQDLLVAKGMLHHEEQIVFIEGNILRPHNRVCFSWHDQRHDDCIPKMPPIMPCKNRVRAGVFLGVCDSAESMCPAPEISNASVGTWF